jgi:cyclohexadienyl dehydratase
MKFGKVIRYFHIVLVIALLGSLVGVDVAWGSMLDKIIGRGHILVGTAGDYKPFTYLNPSTNQFEGIDIDMALHLGKSLGVEVRFVKTSWPTLMKDFLEGKYDIGMGGVSINLERQKKAFFTISYLKDGKTPITRRENVAKFSTLDQIDQPGVKVIVNPGGTNERFVRASIKKATIIVYEDNVTILTKSFKAKPTS